MKLKCTYEVRAQRVGPFWRRRVRVEWRIVPGDWQEAGYVDLRARNTPTLTVVCPVAADFNDGWRVG